MPINGVVCDKCIAVWERNERVNGLFERCKERGDISEKDKRYSFKSVDKAKICDENMPVWKLAAKWNPHKDGTPFLYGDPGTGKTHLAHAMLLRALTDHGRTICTINGPQFSAVLQSFTTAPQAERWHMPQVLLMDDLDKLSGRGEVMLGLWRLFDERQKRGYANIITSNLDPNALYKLFASFNEVNTSLAQATVDRLQPIIPMKLTGKSLRGRKE